MTETITQEKLEMLALTNSKDLPRHVKWNHKGEWRYLEWVGIGWIKVEPNDDSVEIIIKGREKQNG